MTTILHHMDRMREHYTTQSSKIKDNCSQQVDRLRETYETGCGRFKDYRSHRVEKMRENYNAQVCRIREYGMQQMLRLREQYKTQQQYLLKLLELIDVGNCVTVIEAECRKTESVIFDADITFDLEPRPIRMPGNLERGIFDQDERKEMSLSKQTNKKEFSADGFEEPKKPGNNFEEGSHNEYLEDCHNKDFFVDFVIREAQISSSSDEDDNSSRSYSHSLSSKGKMTKDKHVTSQEESSIFFRPISSFAQENFPAFDLPEKKHRKMISSPYLSEVKKSHLDYDISSINCRSGSRSTQNKSIAMKNANSSLSFKDQNFSSSEKGELSSATDTGGMSSVTDTGGISSPSSLSSYNSARAVFDEDFHSVDFNPSSCDYIADIDFNLETKIEPSHNSEASVAFEQIESMSEKDQKEDRTIMHLKSPHKDPESALVSGCHSKLLEKPNDKIVDDGTPKSRMPGKKEKCYMFFIKGIESNKKIKEGIHGRSRYKVVLGGSKLKRSNTSSQSK